MPLRQIGSVVIGTLMLSVAALRAQQPPPIRPIGPIEHVTKDSLLAVTTAVPVAGGRVYVHDIVARRVLLLDSTLANATVVADSSGGTASAYGSRPGTLLPFHRDSALLISPSSLSMLVLSPAGAITRTMAMPPTNSGLVGFFFGNAGFDAQGRMAYVMQVRGANSVTFRSGETGPLVMLAPDSAFIVRFDLGLRKLDTIAILRTPRNKVTFNRDDQGRQVSNTQMVYPIQTVDDWTVTPDGTIALVRGRDYHVDWLGSDGQWTATPKVAFAWEHLDDNQKRTLIDSATARIQAFNDSVQAAAAARAAATPGAKDAGRGGPGGNPFTPPKTIFASAELADVPDYRPPIRQASTRADADGNLWIQTTMVVDKRPVYDVVNRKGEVIDRVQLPNNRRIAGFGPGVIYMSVLDSLKVAHLERARLK